jgi:hypothetical protein
MLTIFLELAIKLWHGPTSDQLLVQWKKDHVRSHDLNSIEAEFESPVRWDGKTVSRANLVVSKSKVPENACNGMGPYLGTCLVQLRS